MSELTLEQKQRRSLAIILEFAMGSTAASSIPTPVFEVPKQLMLTVADLTLCWRLYALYYDEELSKDSLLALINRAGIAPVAGGAIAYAGARTVQGIADVKAFTNEPFEQSRYSRALDAFLTVTMRGARNRAAFLSFIIFALFGTISFVAWHGARMLATKDPALKEAYGF